MANAFEFANRFPEATQKSLNRKIINDLRLAVPELFW